MICVTCHEYYRLSEYNNSTECSNCIDQLDIPPVDSEDRIELDILVNPSGHTKAVYVE